jgi:hypothetical protein
MIARAPTKATAILAALLVVCSTAKAAGSEKLSGAIAGYVTNSAGSPQMGASVMLFNGLERLVFRGLTDEYGSFLFDSLVPGTYTVRVSLASFLPALKRNIVVQPGMRSLLSINLAAVLSSIELVYSSTGDRAVMNDDWKWVLRSSNATRPVLRYAPRVTVAGRRSADELFSDTRGMVKFSAGDQGGVSQLGSETDLGTAFALATSLFGNNQIHVSGNVGYSAATGIPAAGFRTSYSRGGGPARSAQVNLTMRQLYLPARVGAGLASGQQGGAPALRTLSLGVLDRKEIGDGLRVEYGFTMESVSFLDTLNYFSPYGRLSYDLEGNGTVEFAFNSGIPPAEFFAGQRDPGGDLQQDLTALSVFPRVSLRDGRARVQRAENFEVAYHTTVGSRTYAVAAYRESMTNAALTMLAEPGAIPTSDLLPGLLSNSAVFNVGDYATAGYMASVTQALGERMALTLAAGSGNALIPAQSELEGSSGERLRRSLRHGQRRWFSVRYSATAPRTRTALTTSYRWADGKALTAPHLYLTQPLPTDVGMNVHVRQPVPKICSMRGRLEITADLRNLLAQGYLPVSTGAGRRALLLHTPRSVRGGFNFIF